MFTGIIEEVGVVSRKSGHDLTILAKTVLEDVEEGDSIAVNGCCLTVVAFDDAGFTVQTSPETLARTTLGELKPGHAVNLERALTPDTRLGGHFVQGHVDAVGRVAGVRDQGEFSLWRFQAAPEVAKYLVPKGSIAIDGISLTVVDPNGDLFEVAIIPATLRKTTLQTKAPGDLVNMEADMIGKHIYHYLRGGQPSGLTQEFLARHGYA